MPQHEGGTYPEGVDTPLMGLLKLQLKGLICTGLPENFEFYTAAFHILPSALQSSGSG